MSWKLVCRPNALLAYYADAKHTIDAFSIKRVSKREHNGELSINARRKLKQAIRWLSICSPEKEVYEKKLHRKVKWRISMATLTFHNNMTDDNKARQMLSRWLEVAKYRWDIQHYIWKAEPQERGAIHFHLSFNKYIPHKELKFTWNRELRKAGLNSINDNSTDIHACHSLKSTEAYLTDYFLNSEKHEGRRKIKGRLWGCSQNLSQAGKQYIVLDSEEFRALDEELQPYSLSTIRQSKGLEPLPALQFCGYYLLPDNYYNTMPDCELKKQWLTELQLLQPKSKNLQLWPLNP